MALERAVPSGGALSCLSVAALRSAEALQSDEAEVIANHLYSYNSIPTSPDWQRRLADRSGIEQALGLSSHSELRSTLEVSWMQLPSSAIPGWLVWLGRESGLELGGSGPEFKLYVSPAVESLEHVFPEFVRVLTFNRVRSFKAGADAAGLLRPDKLVAYFFDLGDLASAAHELGRRLEGVSPQGVPFTADISGDGLLSWGVDPPARASAQGRRAPSWREWICIRLASVLIEARRDKGESEPLWPLVLERLQDDGIQVDRWLPSPALWRYPP